MSRDAKLKGVERWKVLERVRYGYMVIFIYSRQLVRQIPITRFLNIIVSTSGATYFGVLKRNFVSCTRYK